jgi:hypothetical protein
MAINTNLFSGQHLRYDYESQNWKENDAITVKIKRNGAEQVLKGKIKLPYEEKSSLMQPTQQKTLREAWLG